jgi:hypothetical protein
MKNASGSLVFAIIILGSCLRVILYGDLRLSVAVSDTPSYVESSNVNLLSWEAFTTYRPFTTNLIYKTFTPADDYRYQVIAGGEEGTTHRRIDRGFKDIAVLQSILSILGWAGLAWTFSSGLTSHAVKVLSAGILMLFSLTPQLADWDSVLSAEPPSVSLFMISFAILIWLAFEFYRRPESHKNKIFGFAAFFAVHFLWVFVRDVNVYSLIILGLFVLGLYFIPVFRKTKFFLIAGLIIFSLFIMGEISARQRPLWVLTLTHVFISDVLPFPANVEYFMDRGMPEYGSPEYSEWFPEHAPDAYMQFLIAHPVYTIQKFFRDLELAFTGDLQPYWSDNRLMARPLLIMIGHYLHPRSGTVFFLVTGLLLSLWNHLLCLKNKDAIPWIWLMTWAFMTATATVFFSIFGDTYGLVRHALSSTITYRVLMWMLLLLTLDFSMVRREKQVLMG